MNNTTVPATTTAIMDILKPQTLNQARFRREGLHGHDDHVQNDEDAFAGSKAKVLLLKTQSPPQ